MILQVPAELIKQAIQINNDNAIGVLVACLLVFITILCSAIIWLQVALMKSHQTHIADYSKIMNDYNQAINNQANSTNDLSTAIKHNTIAVENFKNLFDKIFEVKIKA